MTERVVLAYSGGLDTSVAVPWLRESHGHEVVTLTADVGGGADLPAISARALGAGASVAIGVDARAAFVESYVWPALQAGAVYQGVYPLATALARPLIARLLVEAAHETGANLVAHGCTGKGNDQVRFDVAIGALDPSLTVIAPMRKGMGMNRDEELAYARARGIPLEAGTGAGSPYSIDVNLWGRSIEAGVLEDPWVAAPPDAFAWTVDPAEAPRTPSELAIGFEQGIPVTLDGEPLDGVTLIERLNQVGGANGVGRIDHLEDRLVGIKSREIYEAPAAVILHAAHAALEQMVLSRDLLAFKREVGNRLATLTYDGVWFGELATALRGFVARTQDHVNGTVRLRLMAGSASVVGRSSPDSLYRHDLATYGAEDSFDQAAAVGFIALWGLPVRTQSAIHGSAIHNGSLLDQLGALRRTATDAAAAVVDGTPGTPVGPGR
jgi:argininosuccinate synthase